MVLVAVAAVKGYVVVVGGGGSGADSGSDVRDVGSGGNGDDGGSWHIHIFTH